VKPRSLLVVGFAMLVGLVFVQVLFLVTGDRALVHYVTTR
jgi:hypothetical protein